jgi:hypothetical protein
MYKTAKTVKTMVHKIASEIFSVFELKINSSQVSVSARQDSRRKNRENGCPQSYLGHILLTLLTVQGRFITFL